MGPTRPRNVLRELTRPAFRDSAAALAKEVLARRAEARLDPEVASRRRKFGNGHGMIIRDARDVFEWGKGRINELDFEEAWVLSLNRKSTLLHARRLGRGNMEMIEFESDSALDAADHPSLAGFILVHNHPSGIVKPAKADIKTTMEIRDLARKREMRLLDSVIVSAMRYLSMVDAGLLPEPIGVR